jgi:hypothetical protein
VCVCTHLNTENVLAVLGGQFVLEKVHERAAHCGMPMLPQRKQPADKCWFVTTQRAIHAREQVQSYHAFAFRQHLYMYVCTYMLHPN